MGYGAAGADFADFSKNSLNPVPVQKRQSTAALQNLAVTMRSISRLAFWSATVLRRFPRSAGGFKLITIKGAG